MPSDNAKQGDFNDCYLISGLISMYNVPEIKKELKALMKNNITETKCIKFNVDDEEYLVENIPETLHMDKSHRPFPKNLLFALKKHFLNFIFNEELKDLKEASGWVNPFEELYVRVQMEKPTEKLTLLDYADCFRTGGNPIPIFKDLGEMFNLDIKSRNVYTFNSVDKNQFWFSKNSIVKNVMVPVPFRSSVLLYSDLGLMQNEKISLGAHKLCGYLTTKSFDKKVDGFIVPSHCYSVDKITADTITIHNPWFESSKTYDWEEVIPYMNHIQICKFDI